MKIGERLLQDYFGMQQPLLFGSGTNITVNIWKRLWYPYTITYFIRKLCGNTKEKE